MCGISGVFAIAGALDETIYASIDAMTDALRHRGPDGRGVFVDHRVALGHRRLAIIDREGGVQPMRNEDGSCRIVFNGEIYNHHELRKRLIARGHTFTTSSDTEAIVHAYEEYGTACVDHLEGMFAFAVYDTRRRRLFLARDRVGKKPLFYASFGRHFHFASEIKAFYESPFWNPAIDLDALETYFTLGYILAPATMYRQVRKLEPGHTLTVEDGRIAIREYWDVTEFDTDHRSEKRILEDVDATIHDAVVARLESEVPLGAFLSGGIDSGLVVSHMAAGGGGRVITTSVGFSQSPGSNELDAARLTARHFGTEHFESLSDRGPDDVLDAIVGAFDEPFADSSAVPTYFVSEAARRHVTVALSGDGGDEAFAGYDFRYVPHAVEASLRRWVPGALGRGVLRSAAASWPRAPWLPRPLRLATVLDNLGRDASEAYFSDLCFMTPHAARALVGRQPHADIRDSDAFDAVTAPYRRCGSRDAVQRAQYADLKIYLANDVLVKVDRMSMQHGLEVRCPLLDRRVVELAFRIPTSRKLRRLRGKHLLRTLARRRLPPAIATLPKKGFTAPVASWIRERHDQLSSELLAPNAFARTHLDASRVRTMLDEHRRGADHGYALWAVWMLERWSQAGHPVRAAAEPAIV
jgi:asparagine synthase (glutamine-hydrolysing)